MLSTKLMPWHIAVARRTFVTLTTFPLVWSECYWRTWHEVYRYPNGERRT